MHLSESEKSLIQRATRHDEGAFTLLYNKYLSPVYRHVYYRVGNQTDAEDITQEVFVRAWKAIGRYQWTGAPFQSWLTTIAHNLVLDHYQRKTGSKTITVNQPETDIPIKNPIAAVSDGFNPDQISLREEIAKLKGDKQKVIIMRFIEGFSYAEIARALKKKEGAIRVIQYRALKELRSKLGSSEI